MRKVLIELDDLFLYQWERLNIEYTSKVAMTHTNSKDKRNTQKEINHLRSVESDAFFKWKVVYDFKQNFWKFPEDTTYHLDTIYMPSSYEWKETEWLNYFVYQKIINPKTT